MKKTTKSEQFHIVVGADTHYISPKLIRDRELFMNAVNASDGKASHYAGEIMDAFVQNVIAEHPEVLVIAGDLTFNGELASHLELARKLARVKASGIPVVVIPGNHDLYNKRACIYDVTGKVPTDYITAEDFEDIYGSYGMDDCISRSADSYSYIWELNEKNWLLCLDANTEGNEGIVTKKTLEWAEEQLKSAKSQGIRVIGVSHQNLVNQNQVIYNGYTISNGAEVFDLYKKYGVTFNISGHIHLQHERTVDGIRDVATSSLTVCPCQYGYITGDAENLEYENRRVEIESWAKQHKNNSKELMDFSNYSKELFRSVNRNKAIKTVTTINVPEEEKQAMIEGFIKINQAYFEGNMRCLDKDEVQKIYLLWDRNATGIFSTIYLDSMVKETIAG